RAEGGRGWTGREELVRTTPEPGVHAGGRAGGTTVVVSRSLAERGVAVTVRTDGRPGGQAPIAPHAELPPPPVPRPDLFTAGGREIRTALLLPSWHEPGSGKLPVLLGPYGGPPTRTAAGRP